MNTASRATENRPKASHLLSTEVGVFDPTGSRRQSVISPVASGSPEHAKNIFTTRPSTTGGRVSGAVDAANLEAWKPTVVRCRPEIDSRSNLVKTIGGGDAANPEDTELSIFKRASASIVDLHATEIAEGPSPLIEPGRRMEIVVQPSSVAFQKPFPVSEESKPAENTVSNFVNPSDDRKTQPKPKSAIQCSKGKDSTVASKTKSDNSQVDETIYFSDGKRLVDFVLVYVRGRGNKLDASRSGRTVEKERQRLYFEENLRKDGLELEEDIHAHDGPHSETTIFIKVHAPWTVLCRQAEILKLKQPTRLNDPYADALVSDGPSIFVRPLRAIKARLAPSGPANCPEPVPITSCPNATSTITWPFSRKCIELFAVDDRRTFFWPSRRHEMVWEVLQNAPNNPDDKKKRGIESLLERGIYESAFSLHDGPYEVTPNQKASEWCERQVLKEAWAGWRRLFDEQPLGLIRKYYGEKVGFYFAFLGFYVKMLIFPSVVGVATFLYGMLYAGDDVILADMCSKNRTPGTYTMCPLCEPPYCRFTKLYEACVNASWDYRLDNEATVGMAVMTVVWATVTLKLWKRRQAELAFEWDTYDVKIEDSVVRPEFEERAPVKRRNPVTREMEPFIPRPTKLLWSSASTCVTLLMLCGVGAALAALVIARISLYRTFHYLGFHDNIELSRWAVHGLIFIVVVIFEKTYSILAHKLTSLECHRTQQEWLSSYLWKVFIFALLNDFVPIGYAAWVKGRLTSTPLDLSWHSELCDTGGCMSEVTELISVLLLCRLVIGNILEIVIPLSKHAWNRFNEQFKIKLLITRCCSRLFKKKPPKKGSEKKKSSRRRLQRHNAQWHRDFLLGELEEDAVSPEYLEMIVQFAFLTLFIPALPLAPLVCLMNNVIEIRIDSVKFITAHRRPLPVRVPGSQIWNDFLNVICKLAVVCNAGLISFTSNVLPRLYYKFAKQPDQSYEGFVSASLSQLHHSDFKDDEERERAFFDHNVTVCYYEDYRQRDYPFHRTEMWWEIYCIRLAAFAIFLVFSFAFQWLFNFIVADVPAHVNLKIQRRRYVVTKAMEAVSVADAFKHRRTRDNESSRTNGQDPTSAYGAGGSTSTLGEPFASARRRKTGIALENGLRMDD